jgi:hypothetical protein
MRRTFTTVALVLASVVGGFAEAPHNGAASQHLASPELARMAAKALFVDSDLAQARHAAATVLNADLANLEALFVTMEAAALQADSGAELDAAVRLCERRIRDPRLEIAAARILDLAGNTADFRSVAPRVRKLAEAETAQADFFRIALLAAAQDGLPGASVLELAHQAGFLTDWSITGPFGRLPNVDFERAWPPEHKAMTGAVAEFPDGNVTVPEKLSRAGVYYASAQGTIPTTGEWLVRAESSGTFAVYVDGKHALTHDARFRSLPAIASAPLKLAAGRHTVLVKFLPSTAPFRIALARPRYKASTPLLAGTRQEEVYMRAAQQYWAADYAGAIATLAGMSHPSAPAAFLQAQAWAHLASGTAEELSALNAAITAAPDAYSVKTALAARYDSQERLDEALPRVLHVIAARPNFAPAQELKYRLASRMHWEAEASDAITAVLRLHASCSVLRDAANFFRSASQYQRAAEAEDRIRACAIPVSHRDDRIVDVVHPRAIDAADAFYTRFRRDGPQLVRDTASRLFSGGPAVTLLDTRVLHLRPDGGADLYVHKLIRVLDRDGIERHGEVAIPAGVDLIELRTLTPAGDVAGEPELDKRKSTISMPALAPGNVIEQEYVLHYSAGASELERGIAYQFGSFDTPILFAQFGVISPAGARLSISGIGAPSVTSSRAGADEIRLWERNDIAQSVREPDMPRSGQLPEVVVSRPAVTDWSDVRAYDRAEIIDAAHAGERVQQLAATIPGATDTDKAHALYRVLPSKVRAGGHSIEQGLTTAEDTLSAGDGSRTATFLAVARVLGIPAELVLARDIGAPLPRQASLDAYTHPLVRLRLRAPENREQYEIVDVESDGLPFGSLPPTLDRSRALLVPVERASARDPLFIALAGATDSEQSVADGNVVFDSDGNLLATLRITLGTGRASQIRSILRAIPPGGRQRFFEQLATRIFPGAVGVAGEAINENDSERPLQLNVRCRAPHFVSFNGGSADIDQLVPALGLRKLYASLSERRFPLYINDPFFETTRFQVRLPDNIRMAQLAPDFASNERFGNYAVRFREISAHQFEVTRSFHVPVQVIAPADYAEFARFAESIDNAERQRLTVEHADLSARNR